MVEKIVHSCSRIDRESLIFQGIAQYMFISFEGIDCCGKTTQVTLLLEKFNAVNREHLLLREPGGTSISEKIRSILLDKKNLNMTQMTELLLFSASRVQLVNEVIKPALADQKIVICDRYVDSTTAYQGYGRGLLLGAVKTINRVATMDVMPKKTFFIDITVQEMVERRKASAHETDRMELSNEEFFSRVRNGYHELAKEEPNRFVVINGKQTMMEIHEEIWNVVSQLI
jgi:dTMP kinase